MFFSSNQYPSLAHLPVGERKRVVAAATKRQNPWIGRRFFFVLTVIAIGTGALELAAPPLANAELIACGAAVGVLFYLYMLAEINGPIHKAVEAHAREVRQNQDRQSN